MHVMQRICIQPRGVGAPRGGAGTLTPKGSVNLSLRKTPTTQMVHKMVIFMR
jgi:hypothetical protein